MQVFSFFELFESDCHESERFIKVEVYDVLAWWWIDLCI